MWLNKSFNNKCMMKYEIFTENKLRTAKLKGQYKRKQWKK